MQGTIRVAERNVTAEDFFSAAQSNSIFVALILFRIYCTPRKRSIPDVFLSQKYVNRVLCLVVGSGRVQAFQSSQFLHIFVNSFLAVEILKMALKKGNIL